MAVTEVEKVVLELKRQYSGYAWDQGNGRWLYRLVEEVVELALALLHLHRHSASLELQQIASIAMNWLEILEVHGE